VAESHQRKSVAERRKGDRRTAGRRKGDRGKGRAAEADPTSATTPETETEQTTRRRTAAPGTSPWVVPTMVTLLLLGVAWIVVFYVAGYLIPFMAAMGNWNLAVGMGLIAASFVVATQWK